MSKRLVDARAWIERPGTDAMTVYVGLILALLAVAAGVLYRRRLKTRGAPVITDEMIRQIEREGWVEVDSPLDHEEIRKEEEQFWRESWDEPEEW